jgi:hypothetical protein
MIKVVTEEMHGSDRVPDLNTDCERALVGWAHFNESEMARSSECKEQYAQKTLDTADIVRDAWLQQSTSSVCIGFMTAHPSHK